MVAIATSLPTSLPSFEVELLSSLQTMRKRAISLTGNTEEAKDLLQETYLKALRYRHLFQEGTNLSAWLHTIMRNTFLTHKSTEKHLSKTVDTEAAEHLLVPRSTRNKAFSQFVKEELQGALEKVDTTLREPFLLHCNGFKYREIAEDLAIPEGTVKNRIHLAKKELQLFLAPYKDMLLD